MPGLIKKYWFIGGLVLVFGITLADHSQAVAWAGRWLKAHHGPDLVIFMIFFFSGLMLDSGQIRAGLKDTQGLVTALAVIFVGAPLIAAGVGLSGLDTGIKIGLFLVAVMPTTLSSGVVMTGAAGGNMAHALLVTVVANALAVLTIPFALSLLLGLVGGTAVVVIDKPAIMIKLGLLVMLPLTCGLRARLYAPGVTAPWAARLQITNQLLVLGIVWMALSQAREVIINSGKTALGVFLLVMVFHGLLLILAAGLAHLQHLGSGRRESVIFMGAQKTLPLSVILQVSLFPQYGLALVVCVTHHVVHLLMDGYLVARLKSTAAAVRCA